MDMKFLTDIAQMEKDDEVLQKSVENLKLTLNLYLKLLDNLHEKGLIRMNTYQLDAIESFILDFVLKNHTKTRESYDLKPPFLPIWIMELLLSLSTRRSWKAKKLQRILD